MKHPVRVLPNTVRLGSGQRSVEEEEEESSLQTLVSVTSSQTVRSRTDPEQNSGSSMSLIVECPSCLESVKKSDEIWVCYQCACVAHITCLPVNHWGTITTVNGCPICRKTEREVLEDVKKVSTAPHGAWCSGCWRWIVPDSAVVGCPMPKSECVAMYHQRCYRDRCSACRHTAREGIIKHRTEKVTKVKRQLPET